MSTDTDSTDVATEKSASSISFCNREGRKDDMQAVLEEWAEELSDLTDEAQASGEFQEWLDVHARFHDYSYRNTLLIRHQCPGATKVAGYWTWQNEFSVTPTTIRTHHDTLDELPV